MQDTDRETLESGEARELVGGFLHNGKSQDWLKAALKISRRIYGVGSEERIRAYMRDIWKSENLL